MRLLDLFPPNASGLVFRAAGDDIDALHNPLVIDCVSDSRQVTPGAVFVALPGTKTRGTEFVPHAVARGAVAIVSGRPIDLRGLPSGMVNIVADNPRKTYARATAALFGNPAEDLTLIGITGTNGKTTTATLIQQALGQLGVTCGRIGTTGIDHGDGLRNGVDEPASMTTPDARDLQRHFLRMREQGCTHAVMEVSSHALDQQRIAGLNFKVAVFTNLTRDHLDYHKTMAAYAHAKARLFSQLDPHEAVAVINTDDEAAPVMIAASTARVRTFGFGVGASVRADRETLAQWVRGSAVDVALADEESLVSVLTPLTGHYNVSNVLGALTSLIELGFAPFEAAEALSNAAGAPGRLERVEIGSMGVSPMPTTRHTDQPSASKGANVGLAQSTTFSSSTHGGHGRDAHATGLPDVFVDYAHTPDALENVLKSVRGVVTGKVTVVFGCGGDRDRTKRPMMGAIAARLADRVVVTSDNPRTERPGEIIEEIAAGFPPNVEVDTHIVRIRDRRIAIAHAIATAEPGETIVIAGKGHEDYQVIGKTTVHFDDREVAREVLSALALNIDGKRPAATLATPSTTSGRLFTHPLVSARLKRAG